ncbi:MAG: serine O-acetyltransferase [Deltaproteobacteria bacterium]|nr:serine O-acetyltransferase [Deltaproteobacteria bacterium]
MSFRDLVALLREDVRAILDRDPAARNPVEVVTCYPGLHAVWGHRIAHALWMRDAFWLARVTSQLTRWLTGIEIHPAARIGRRLFIDHGMGVVIGQTAEIGDDVTILQGVTLGGTSTRREKRHPTVEDNVVIGAGAAVIGRVRVGRDSKIGSGSVVIRDVPPHSTVVGIPGRVIFRESAEAVDLDHTDLPDLQAATTESLWRAVRELHERFARLERRGAAESDGDGPLGAGEELHDRPKP